MFTHKTPAFLLFLVCCSFVLTEKAVSDKSIHFTAFINPDSRIGREQKVAIEIAVNEFNSSVSSIILNISNSTNKEEVNKKRTPDSIIVMGSWPEVVNFAEMGSKARIPILSLTATQPQPLALAPNPFLFRMSYSMSSYTDCLADLVKLYNWRRAIVIYEENIYGSVSSSIIPLLSNALQSIGSDIDYQAAFPPLDSLSEPYTMIYNKLETINQRLCKVFIVLHWSSPSLALDLFKGAKALGMMDKGNVWITGDDITGLVDLSLTPSFISSYMQGVIGIKTHLNKSTKSYSDFHVKFQQKYKSEYSQIGETNFEPGMHALQAYDAVGVIAHAMVRGLNKSEELVDRIQASNFVGMSGLVRFKEDGGLIERKGTPAFQLINFVGRSHRDLGFWIKGLGFVERESEMDGSGPLLDSLDPVYWPGGPKKVPGGWAKLRIGVPNRTAFDQFVKVEYDKEGEVKNVTGFCIDVFYETLKRLKYDLPYEFLPFNGTYDELVASVPKACDAVVGDITILATRQQHASFTEPYLPSGLVKMVRTKPDHTPWMLAKPFSNNVWYSILGSLFYTGLIVWCLEHKINPEFNGPWWTQFGATFWLISSTIFFKHGRVHSYYTKVVIVAWLIAVLILTTTYTASLSSILTSQKLEPMANDSNIGCDGDSFVLRYLQDVLKYNKKKIKKIGSEYNYPKAFDSGNITAAYLEVPYMRVFLAQNKGYTAYGEIHRVGGFGFVFPKGSPLADDISQIILELIEDGTLKNLEDKWFTFSMTSCPNKPNDENSDSLTLDSFWALFIFTGATTTIVFILFKARLLPDYSRRTWAKIGVPVREKCARWKSNLGRRKVRQLLRRPSFTSPKIAHDPCEVSVVVAESNQAPGDIEVGSLPNPNNI